jgi:hypothetical protein
MKIEQCKLFNLRDGKNEDKMNRASDACKTVSTVLTHCILGVPKSEREWGGKGISWKNIEEIWPKSSQVGWKTSSFWVLNKFWILLAPCQMTSWQRFPPIESRRWNYWVGEGLMGRGSEIREHDGGDHDQGTQYASMRMST